MSFQAGVRYFDSRPVPPGEADAIRGSIAVHGYPAPASWSAPGIMLAQSDVAEWQPYVNKSGAITLDGRLDNIEDLRLVARDHVPAETGEAALALAAYQTRSLDGLASLIGDWSLAIWDDSDKRLVLASDFGGVRPLHYMTSATCIRWSTSVKPLRRYLESEQLDDEYVAGFLLYEGCPHRTPFRGIRSVPPGHALIASTRGIEIRPYWHLPTHNLIRYQRDSDYDEQLRELFRQAVRRRLQTKWPALVELSGGLDSSSVVCMASGLVNRRRAGAPKIITVTYERPDSLDTRFQNSVEEWCGTESVHLPATEGAFLSETNSGDSRPAFWQELHMSVASIARERGARVLLTGSQGDLVMGNSWEDCPQIFGLLRTGRIRTALKEAVLWSKAVRVPITYILWRLVSTGICSSRFAPTSEGSIAAPFCERLGLSLPHRFFSDAWTQTPLERRELFRNIFQMLELRRLQPPEPLMHLFWTHPYMDRTLLSFLLSIPPEIICGPGDRRRLMRHAFSPFWPPALRTRRSKDVFDGLFYNALRPIAARLLPDVDTLHVVKRGYIDPSHLRVRLERLIRSLDCNQPQLRLILALELWLRQNSNLS